MRMLGRLLKWVSGLALLALVGLVGVRAYDIQRGPPLSAWHMYVPDDAKADDLAKLDWNGYLDREKKLFDSVRANVTDKLPPEERVPANRYFDGSPIYPGKFKDDWNRSYAKDPDGAPQGAVVLLHGLTDSPYSLRHVARAYQARGWAVIAPRLPGHGTVPAGLTEVQWEDWSAATRLAMREARRRAGPEKPLHLIGFSNGGALAMKYSLDALEDKSLPRAERVVLLSPMIGITAFARFAGVFGWPAVFPAFANAAWLGIVPEFNPFKYNSFPINGARQSSLLTRALQSQINDGARAGRLAELPPVLTFQSVVDFTVSTRAIVTALYNNLPANGSELVLYDVNRAATLSPLLRSNLDNALDRLLADPPRRYRTVVVTNAGSPTGEVIARTTDAGATAETTRNLGVAYPKEMYSLSHVAIPFPMSDALYGLRPEPGESFGVNLGTVSARGEVGLLIVGLESLIRASSNPFFDYLLNRIEQDIPAGAGTAPAAAATAK
jgi:alpha-beta hydrolase superfamily lysophospholipase